MPNRFYHLANVVLRRVLFPIGLKLKVEGVEHVPLMGPLIVAVNHTSFIDPMLVGAYTPRDVIMMAKQEAFHTPVVGWFVQHYGAFPIQRGEVDRTALKKALDVLRHGGALLMAPEGTRSADGQLQAGHDGLAMIAARSNACVLPFAIAGAQFVSQNLKKLKRTPVQIHIGKPFQFETQNGKASRADLTSMTDQLMVRLAALLPPEQQGIYRERLKIKAPLRCL
jgi:1-acyl-sn-glycerol-3-phosphate acyltransferase